MSEKGNTLIIRGIDLPLLAITFIGIGVRLLNSISQPPVIDDVQMAFTARNFVERGQFGPTAVYHPELRNILLYLSGRVFGYSALAMRGWSIIAGGLTVLLIGLIALRLFRSRKAAYLAASLVAFDGLSVMYSRNPYQSISGAFFTFAGILYWLRYREGKGLVSLAAAGISFGLGAASIWQALFPLAFCLLFSIWEVLGGKEAAREMLRVLALHFSGLAVLPLTVYIVTFLPWFRRGYGLERWLQLQKTFYLGVTSNLPNMVNWVTDSNRAWQWFVRPVSNSSFGVSTSGRWFIYSGISNPFVWMLVLPAILFVINRTLAERDRAGAIFIGLFSFSYLPFLFSSRNIFTHSALFVFPLGAIAIGYLVERTSRRQGWFLAAYSALALAGDIYLLPLALGLAMHLGYLQWILALIRP